MGHACSCRADGLWCVLQCEKRDAFATLFVRPAVVAWHPPLLPSYQWLAHGHPHPLRIFGPPGTSLALRLQETFPEVPLALLREGVLPTAGCLPLTSAQTASRCPEIKGAGQKTRDIDDSTSVLSPISCGSAKLQNRFHGAGFLLASPGVESTCSTNISQVMVPSVWVGIRLIPDRNTSNNAPAIGSDRTLAFLPCRR